MLTAFNLFFFEFKKIKEETRQNKQKNEMRFTSPMICVGRLYIVIRLQTNRIYDEKK